MKIIKRAVPVILLAALIGTGYYAYNKRESTPPISQQGDETKLMKETEAISVNVTYPLIPGKSKGEEDANTLIKGEINKRIADFVAEAQDNLKTDIDLPKNIKSSIVGSPSIQEKEDGYVSVFMGMEWYLRGASHPWHTIDTYVYDYAQGKLTTAEDMFKPGADYLALLSQLSYQDLRIQSKEGDMGFVFDESMVAEGTKPTRENFSRMLPIRDGLVVYFSEYQVAPYAAGPQQVVIPYEKLKEIINPDGVMGMYIK